MLSRSVKRTVSIVGAGRVGASLGKRLRQLGWRIGAVVTRSPASALAAVRTIGGGSPFAGVTGAYSSANSGSGGRAGLQPRRRTRSSHRALAPEAISSPILAADVILLTTPDDVLPSAVRTLAKMRGSGWREKIILHTSGTLDRSVLAPLTRLGAATGSIHPMQAFGGKITPKLAGVTFAVEGHSKARRVAQAIAKSLGGVPITIDSRDKAIYHAAAVMAAGSGYALIETGTRMLMRVGFTRQRAMQTLLPLIRQMLDNVERIGARAAWTGPLSRGDYKIVAKHAKALRSYPKEFQHSYAALALLAGRVLAKNPAATVKQIRRALRV